MIVTGEASGDLHGSNLVRALQSKDPSIQFSGMGGPELESLGVDIVCDAEKVSVVGIVEVFSHLRDILTAQKALRTRLAADRPDLLIIIDLPDFNLLLAKKAKKLGIPVFYYITPQVWAWRSGRVKTIKNRTDQLGVIFPFEENFFKERGVDATYVGHPSLDSVKASKSKSEFFDHYGLDHTSKLIGLLPGSRTREILSLLPVFLESAHLLQQSSRDSLIFVIPKAASIGRVVFEEAGLSRFSNIDVRLIEDDRYDLMSACDCVVAASGTVTVELAILHTPMVVTYKLSPITYKLAKRLVKLDFFSLVNLIAEYCAVTELLQDEVEPKAISRELMALLYSYPRKQAMRKDFDLVNKKLGSTGASDRAADLVMTMLGR
ncbi:lipid-A-disaccharide synthase [Desulforhopalus sp. 52FAK]